MGNAGMYVSGKTTILALARDARLIRAMALSVVARALRKMGETWQAAARSLGSMLYHVSDGLQWTSDMYAYER